MKSAYQRKKQPELVKEEILKATISLAEKKGLGAITVQAVAELAGITKGGLLHHYPSKQALIKGVFDTLMEEMDRDLEALMAKDKKAYGRFTRAYVELCFDCPEDDSQPWSALCVSVLVEPQLKKMWQTWMDKQLKKHRKTDSGIELELVRMAADGFWFTHLSHKTTSKQLQAKLKKALLAQTFKNT
ncbi:TetR/AcrR family transcriptional regulator [Bdellovibrio sp. HCB274]|uniref:TetR/AcrR family transcriptional regulator n=1 Tax=Bdellovibrio sp. HCB274 TaxID=3394361 RepID=UPI0039B66D0D